MLLLCYKLLILQSCCLGGMLQLQLVNAAEHELWTNFGDDLDLSHVNWRAMIPMLLQRQQVRLCISVYRYDPLLIAGTDCERLLRSEELMEYCDIGHIEDLSMTMRDAFGGMLFDTLQKCRPGLELFGVRCRRRA